MNRTGTGPENYEHVLMCLICRSLFDDHDHQPKFLPCHHTFCKECLRQYVEQMGDEIECPACRKVATIPAAGVSALQTNFYAKYIQGLVYGCSGTSTGWVNNCINHPGDKLVHYCQDCAVSLCDVCLRERGCHRHKCDVLTAVIEKYRCDLDASFSGTNTLIERKKVELERLMKVLAEEKDKALIKIEGTFEQHIHALTRRATLLKNKVIDIYNEHCRQLEADLEEISTGLTCIVSLKEHYESMVGRGDFADRNRGIEEMSEVHRNILERIQPRISHIVFEDEYGADAFRNGVRELGRVLSIPSSAEGSDAVEKKQAPKSDGELSSVSKIVSVTGESNFGMELTGDCAPAQVQHITGDCAPVQVQLITGDCAPVKVQLITGDCAPAQVQHVKCLVLPPKSASNCSTSSSFKSEVSVNIKNNSSLSTESIDTGQELNNNPTLSHKLPSKGQTEKKDDDQPESGKKNLELCQLSTNPPSNLPTVAHHEVKIPVNSGVVSQTVVQQQPVPSVVSKVEFYADVSKGDRPFVDSSRESTPTAMHEGRMARGEAMSVPSIVVCSANCATLQSGAALVSEMSPCAMNLVKTDTGYRVATHKSYEEPRLRLELGYETSDVEDGGITPLQQMSRSDFWLMMSSSVESNLSEHDLIVAELSGEQTSL